MSGEGERWLLVRSSSSAPRITGASNPGRLLPDKTLVARYAPNLSPRHRLAWSHLEAHLDGGDVNPAIVVTTTPLRVGCYSEDLDAVVILRFDTITDHTLHPGDRLLSVNTYFRNDVDAPDVDRGERGDGLWANFHPVVADFYSSDTTRLDACKRLIAYRDWDRCAELIATYQRQHSDVDRDGNPAFSGTPRPSVTTTDSTTEPSSTPLPLQPEKVNATLTAWAHTASAIDLDALALTLADSAGRDFKGDRATMLLYAGHYTAAAAELGPAVRDPLPHLEAPITVTGVHHIAVRAAVGDRAALVWLTDVHAMMSGHDEGFVFTQLLWHVSRALGDTTLERACVERATNAHTITYSMAPASAAHQLCRRRSDVATSDLVNEVTELYAPNRGSAYLNPERIRATVTELSHRNDSAATWFPHAVADAYPFSTELAQLAATLSPRTFVRTHLHVLLAGVSVLLLTVLTVRLADPYPLLLGAALGRYLLARIPQHKSTGADTELYRLLVARLAVFAPDGAEDKAHTSSAKRTVFGAVLGGIAGLGYALLWIFLTSLVHPQHPELVSGYTLALVNIVGILWFGIAGARVARTTGQRRRPALSPSTLATTYGPCACWQLHYISGDEASTYPHDHLNPAELPTVLLPLTTGTPSLSLSAFTCPHSGVAWLRVQHNDLDSCSLLRSDLPAALRQPVAPVVVDEAPTGMYL